MQSQYDMMNKEQANKLSLYGISTVILIAGIVMMSHDGVFFPGIVCVIGGSAIIGPLSIFGAWEYFQNKDSRLQN